MLIVAVNVTLWLEIDGLAEETSTMLLLALLTICAMAVELLAVRFASPPKEAAMRWLPTVKLELLKLAVVVPRCTQRPLAYTGAASEKITTPVGPTEPLPVTVAVSLRSGPYRRIDRRYHQSGAARLIDDLRDGCRATCGKIRVPAEAGRHRVTAHCQACRAEEAVVTPPAVLTPAALPKLLPSIRNWTVPVGVPVPGAAMLMVAVKVNACPNADGLAEETSTVLVPAWSTVWPPRTYRCCWRSCRPRCSWP